MTSVEGFVEIERRGRRVLARPEARAWAERALQGPGTLHRAAARARGAVRLEGRGPVYVVPADPDEVEVALGTSGTRWAVRHYRRGGAVAWILRDRYLRVGTPRPVRELRASVALRERRIPTPRVVAAAVYPSGLFYRGDLVTTFLAGTVELAGVLFDPERRGVGGSIDRRQALGETGALIRRMAGAGVYHRDVNARNVLLEWSGEAPRAHVVDLDRCTVGEGPLPDAARAMHVRLVRSIRKLGERADLPLPEGDFKALAAGVEGR